jgi:2-keto-4-pentenoate hydratase/2-oxohepta-3-ene-1,7-dioic acid hydratase in catechol pathway
MIDLIRRYAGTDEPPKASGPGRDLAGIEVAPPLRPLRNVMCVGKNYRVHAEEFAGSGFDGSAGQGGEAVPSVPIIFTKAPETVVATREAIRYPAGLSDSIDYEAELAVVIGKGGRGIARADALDHVFGYTIANDVTARDLQAKHKQWFIGKSLDTFCPMGPWIATADQVDVANLDIRCRVNGELRQDANTSDLTTSLGKRGHA